MSINQTIFLEHLQLKSRKKSIHILFLVPTFENFTFCRVFTWEADVSNDELIPVPYPARARPGPAHFFHHHLHTIIATTNVILLKCSYYHICHSWMELPGSHYQLGIKHMNISFMGLILTDHMLESITTDKTNFSISSRY